MMVVLERVDYHADFAVFPRHGFIDLVGLGTPLMPLCKVQTVLISNPSHVDNSKTRRYVKFFLESKSR